MIDIYHLKNSELEPQFLKDDSGAYAVFTEKGSSGITNDQPQKVMDVIARLPDCDGQATDTISEYTQVKMEDAQKLLKNSQIRMSGCMDTSSKTYMAEVVGIH